MDKFLEILIILVIAGATLAFGGVHAITYSLAEVLLFLAVLLLLYRQLRQGRINLPLPFWPLLFALWVILQVVPLPARLIADLSPARLWDSSLRGLPVGDMSWTSLSIDSHETVVALLKFVAYLSTFLLAAYLFDSRKRKSAGLRALIVLGCFEAGYGIAQYLTGWNKIFTYTNIYDTGNAFGTYINRNHYAGLLELVMPFVLASAFYSIQKSSELAHGNERRASSRSSVNFQALFYLFLMAIMFVALVFSRSRGGILAATFSVVFIVLLGQVKVRRKGWMLFVVLFLALIVGYGLWIGLDPVLVRFEQMGEKDFLRMEARTQIGKDTLSLVSEYRLTGTGLGTFGVAYRRYQTVAVENYVDHAHNDFLEFAAETGWLGLALLFLPILYLFVRMIISFLNDSHRYCRSVLLGCIGSTLALLIHSFTDFNLQMPANALIFAVVLGIGYKVACIEPREEARTASGR